MAICGVHHKTGRIPVTFRTVIKLKLSCINGSVLVDFVPVLATDQTVSPDELANNEHDVGMDGYAKECHRDVVEVRVSTAEPPVRDDEHVAAFFHGVTGEQGVLK